MTVPNPFLDPVLVSDTLDIYWAKASILKAIRRELPSFHGTLLDVGCGEMPYRDVLTRHPASVSRYIGLDLEGDPYGGTRSVAPDLTWDGRTIPLPDASVDTAIATEVLEHCPRPDLTLSEVHRVLRPGGKFFLTVPFLWPLHDSPHDYWRYTPFALEQLLSDAGFRDIRMTSLGGWDAALGQMLSLWLKRRPCSTRCGRSFRRLLTRLSLPLVRALYRRDHPTDNFLHNPMITGLSGMATR